MLNTACWDMGGSIVILKWRHKCQSTTASYSYHQHHASTCHILVSRWKPKWKETTMHIGTVSKLYSKRIKTTENILYIWMLRQMEKLKACQVKLHLSFLHPSSRALPSEALKIICFWSNFFCKHHWVFQWCTKLGTAPVISKKHIL